MGEGLLDPAGEPFAPGQAPREVLAVIDLDNHIGRAVERGVTARCQQTCFVIGALWSAGVQLMDIEAFALYVLAVDHGNEPAHRGPL